MESNQARGVQLVATTLLNPPAGRGGRGGPRAGLTPEQLAQIDRGGQIYNELCFACHAPDGLGTPKPELATTMAPPLAGSPRVNGHSDYIIKTVLHGLGGPVDGKTYTDMMIPMGNFDDEWIAAVGSYVRYSFGNTGGFITPADVARVRAANAGRKTLWTLPELTASLPAPLFTDGWKLTASHNADAATGAHHADDDGTPADSRPACGSRSSCQSRRPSRKSSFSRRRRAGVAGRDRGGRDVRRRAGRARPPGFRVDTKWKSRRMARRGRRSPREPATAPARSSRSRRSRRSSSA